MTKIGYICGTKSWGGLEMNQLHNAVWMKKRGHSVCILCKAGSEIKIHAEKMNLDVVLIPEHRRYKYLKAGFALKKITAENELSHLIIRNSSDLNICSIAKRFSSQSLKLVYFMEMQLGVSKKSFLHTARFKQLDAWVCSSHFLKQQVLSFTRFPGNKIQLLHPGLELERFEKRISSTEARKQLALPEKKYICGLIGRIDPLKGQDLLIEALNLIQNPEIYVCLMGSPTLHESSEFYEKLLGAIRDKKLEDRIFILPFREDVSVFYQAIDVCIMASKSETFGMVSIEALAHGVPVIGSNAGGTPEILENGELGLLFESGNAKDLAEKMVYLHQHPDLFSPEKLMESVEKYDSTSVCEEVEGLLGLTSLIRQ